MATLVTILRGSGLPAQLTVTEPDVHLGLLEDAAGAAVRLGPCFFLW
jgi:hypothetical protein